VGQFSIGANSTGRFMRHVKVRPGGGASHDALRELIGQAYADLKARLAQ